MTPTHYEVVIKDGKVYSDECYTHQVVDKAFYDSLKLDWKRANRANRALHEIIEAKNLRIRELEDEITLHKQAKA